MVTCPKCSTANTPGSTFCIGCGTDLPLGAAVAGPPSPQYAGPPPGSAPPPWSQAPPPQPTYPQPNHPQPSYPPSNYPPAGYPPYGRVPAYGGPQVNNNMALAVVSLVVGFIGCLVLAVPGLVAVIMASQVNNKLAMGDVNGATQAARHAKIWAIVGLAIAAALLAVFFVVLLVSAASVNRGA
ncbi:MAG: Interferon-induced transrane protein [Acidimicrobiaceae bacterium]|nr:Interferon-induced transrane protein [Acidimicrobiaceae bacterium]